MANVEVRPAVETDAAGLARVHTQSWREAYEGLISADFLAGRRVEAQTWVRRLAGSGPRARTLVAVDAEEVVGFASVGPQLPTTDDDSVGHLYAIYLLADFWGTGIGRRLHVEAMDALVASGFATAVLWVLDTNARAIAFYEREGWRLDGASQAERAGEEALSELPMGRVLNVP